MATLDPFDFPHHTPTEFTFAIRRALWDMALKTCTHCNGRVNIPYEPRLPNSPFVAMIWRGRAENDALPLCPADVHWYLRFLKREGKVRLMAHGPTTKATTVPYNRDDEFLGIRFQPGIFLPHLPPNAFVNNAIDLSGMVDKSFELHGSAWEVPTYENADIFIDRLMHAGLLAYDPVVATVLQGQFQERTVRSRQMRFLRATGLTQKVFQQIERARYTAALLEQGVPIMDGVFKAGYCDQSHLTRSLKRFLSQTPSQIVQMSQLE
ncbi:MAG: AraC family transcriptional regulator [Ktedonobacteraceae bacterium]|nr:AraC family transcriptional regulator [Ktedonobacteraceae bacterium]